MRDEYNPVIVARFWSHVDRSGDGCWLWTASTVPNGYGQFLFNGRNQHAHRVAYQLAVGPIPDGLLLCHSCDVRRCCRIEPDGSGHLWPGTQKDNMADAAAKGRTASGMRGGMHTKPEMRPRGERHGGAKLTDEIVRTIRLRYAAGGVTMQALANEYKLAHSAIGNVIARKRWSHID